MNRYLIFDTETTGFYAKNRLVQLAWRLYQDDMLIEEENFIVRPYKFTIPKEVTKLHGITTEYATKYGFPLGYVLREFNKRVDRADYLVGHNISYDLKVLTEEFRRMHIKTKLNRKKVICTMHESTNYLKLPRFASKGSSYKFPKLEELYEFLFGRPIKGAHNALYDVRATAESFFELMRRRVIKIK
jgi:DNA polymerase III epsilon subunit-like protein